MSLDLQHYPTLALAQTPEKLRQLPQDKLRELADELREYLLNCVSQTSGHFASGLGTVELTVALHYVYNTPFDRLLWDVGHRAYPHKILTGRAERMSTIRQKMDCIPFHGLQRAIMTPLQWVIRLPQLVQPREWRLPRKKKAKTAK